MPVERRGSDVRISPPARAEATVRLPGSKSIANRYLTCCALADGDSALANITAADDVLVMIDGLRALGVRCELRDAALRATVSGCRGNLPADEAEIDVHNAGTAMRFLTALACLGHGRYRLDGTARMRQRPIGALVDALHEIGAGIGYDGETGYPPITMVARGLAGGAVVFREPPSSQYLSALLMVAPYAARDVMLRVDGALPSKPYVDLTVNVMRSLGVEVVHENGRWIVPSFQRYRAGTFAVEPDASAATYFWAAAGITGMRVTTTGLSRSSWQGDSAFVDVLQEMGCAVRDGADGLSVEGPAPGELRAVSVDLNAMPDTVQTLAVAALFANGTTRIRNVANLRIKETDRLHALRVELERCGATVEERPDGLAITPPREVRPVAFETYDDHRMAMSLALVGLRVAGVLVRDADCVGKSFPEYWDVLSQL